MIFAQVVAALVGVGVGLFAMFVAFAMTGAGHGWITPMWFSPLGAVAYPVVLVRLLRPASGTAFDGVIVVIAILLDVMLLIATLDEGMRYFSRVGGAAWLWLALWFGWQAVAIVSVMRAPHGRAQS